MEVKILIWWVGRVVECTGLENQSTYKGTGGSNPPPTALVRDESHPLRLNKTARRIGERF